MDMLPPPTLSPLEQLDKAAPSLVATRYFALIGLVLLLWDHVLTFEGELTYIWRLPFELTKVVFVFNRYFVEGALLLVVYVLLGLHAAPLSQEVSPCHTFILFIACTSITAMSISHLTVTFHIQAIWDKQRNITFTLLVGFCITYGVTIVCAGLVANDFQAHIVWVPVLNTCLVPYKPKAILGVWAGMITFDVFVMVMLLANAVNRPYRESSEILENLRKDGIKFLAALLTIRSINFVLTIFSKPGQVLVIVFFLWAVVSITLSRLILMVKAMERETALIDSRATTPTTFWRSESGYWSRKSDFVELQHMRRGSTPI